MPDLFTNTPAQPTINQPVTTQPPAVPPVTNAATVPPPGPLIPNPDIVEHHIHVLSSFCTNPVGISFDGQESDEQILLLLRKHFITNVPWILLGTIFLIAPIVIHFITVFFNMQSFFAFLPTMYALLLTIFYYSIIFTYFFINFMTWYYNITLITTKRIIDVDFSELIYKNVSATKISLIQDTNFTQVGIVRTFFDYGDVMVQTAATVDNFDSLAVPHPQRVVQIIESLIGKGPSA